MLFAGYLNGQFTFFPLWDVLRTRGRLNTAEHKKKTNNYEANSRPRPQNVYRQKPIHPTLWNSDRLWKCFFLDSSWMKMSWRSSIVHCDQWLWSASDNKTFVICFGSTVCRWPTTNSSKTNQWCKLAVTASRQHPICIPATDQKTEEENNAKQNVFSDRCCILCPLCSVTRIGSFCVQCSWKQHGSAESSTSSVSRHQSLWMFCNVTKTFPFSRIAILRCNLNTLSCKVSSGDGRDFLRRKSPAFSTTRRTLRCLAVVLPFLNL